ncbi:MAG: Hsp20/alpha crystallin family protein [bacterium]|nr:Hsp20/alpha crystallin family protein [bacterium]
MASFFEKLKNSMGVEMKEEKPTSAKNPESKQVNKIPVKGASPKQEAHVTQEKPDDWFEPEGELAVDVYETGDDITVQATIAGVNPDDLNVSIENDVVTITGERQNTEEEEGKNYFYQECYWGAFSRQIVLPSEVDGGRAEASMKNGIFTLKIPKVERKKLRKIKVRS